MCLTPRALIAVLALFTAAFKPEESRIAPSVVVVELFTTEGCSSCPSADELLHEMTRLISNEGKSVFALSFHVTYFNHLGWHDPYSKEEFTARQKAYCKRLKVELGPYTPQAVVNGQYEFVGSNPIKFRNVVEEAYAKPALYTISGRATSKHGFIVVDYELDKQPKNEIINYAIVEKHIERKITRGENKNRTLNHYNVVRKFETEELEEKDSKTMLIPDDLNLKNCSVILYIQNKSMKVLGAASVEITLGPHTSSEK